MAPVDPRDPVYIRSPSAGPCFLYVAPSVYEDLLKLGFSRNPLARLQALHPRWFEVFDLERALLVETETVRDARRIELRLRRRLVEHNAPAPLTIRRGAGGHTEWYRGAYDELRQATAALEAEGHVRHAPARDWYRRALCAHRDALYGWTLAMLGEHELVGDGAGCAAPARHRACRAHPVRDALDAFAALDIELEPWLSAEVLRWYRG